MRSAQLWSFTRTWTFLWGVSSRLRSPSGKASPSTLAVWIHQVPLPPPALLSLSSFPSIYYHHSILSSFGDSLFHLYICICHLFLILPFSPVLSFCIPPAPLIFFHFLCCFHHTGIHLLLYGWWNSVCTPLLFVVPLHIHIFPTKTPVKQNMIFNFTNVKICCLFFEWH